METIVDIRRKAKAWDVMLERCKREDWRNSLGLMNEIIQSLMPTYYNWEWALTKLKNGESVRWKDWGDSYIILTSIGIRRYSEFHGKYKDMGYYGIYARDKLLEKGWCLYEGEV